MIHMLNKRNANLRARFVMHKLIYYLLEQWFNSIRGYLKFKHVYVLHLEKKSEISGTNIDEKGMNFQSKT